VQIGQSRTAPLHPSGRIRVFRSTVVIAMPLTPTRSLTCFPRICVGCAVPFSTQSICQNNRLLPIASPERRARFHSCSRLHQEEWDRARKRIEELLKSGHKLSPWDYSTKLVQLGQEDKAQIERDTNPFVQKPVRTLFYVPCSKPKMLEKAWQLKVDNVVCLISIKLRRLSTLKIRSRKI
jgi:hypothetical protein